MIGQAQLSIDDLLGQLSRQFIEQLLVLSAQTVAGSDTQGVMLAKFAGTALKVVLSPWATPNCTSTAPGYGPQWRRGGCAGLRGSGPSPDVLPTRRSGVPRAHINKSGAAGNLASEAVARATPDKDKIAQKGCRAT